MQRKRLFFFFTLEQIKFSSSIADSSFLSSWYSGSGVLSTGTKWQMGTKITKRHFNVRRRFPLQQNEDPPLLPPPPPPTGPLHHHHRRGRRTLSSEAPHRTSWRASASACLLCWTNVLQWIWKELSERAMSEIVACKQLRIRIIRLLQCFLLSHGKTLFPLTFSTLEDSLRFVNGNSRTGFHQSLFACLRWLLLNSINICHASQLMGTAWSNKRWQSKWVTQHYEISLSMTLNIPNSWRARVAMNGSRASIPFFLPLFCSSLFDFQGAIF